MVIGLFGGGRMSRLPDPKDFAAHRMEFAKVERYADETESLPLEQVEAEFMRFSPTVPRDELLQIVPDWLLESAAAADRDLFNAMLRYDERNHTAVTGCYDNQPFNMQIISYKRRRFNGGKWITRKGTHPNGTPFVRIFTDDQPIVIVEGHHDSLTAALMGLDFVMLPTASYRGDLAADEVRGRDLLFIVEDSAAYGTMLRIAKSVETVANEITLRQLRRGEKMDLSDLTEQSKSIQEVRSCLYGI
jgi:hypothetical protein